MWMMMELLINVRRSLGAWNLMVEQTNTVPTWARMEGYIFQAVILVITSLVPMGPAPATVVRRVFFPVGRTEVMSG